MAGDLNGIAEVYRRTWKAHSLLPHLTLDSEVKTGERMMYGKFVAGHVSEECVLGVSSSIQDVGARSMARQLFSIKFHETNVSSERILDMPNYTCATNYNYFF